MKEWSDSFLQKNLQKIVEEALTVVGAQWRFITSAITALR